jgi:hypothetical protein
MIGASSKQTEQADATLHGKGAANSHLVIDEAC